MREHAGLSIQDAADQLGTNRSHVTNMELARFGVSADRVRTLSGLYACPDSAYVEGLVCMTGDRKAGWWEEYRGHIAASGLDLAELEHHAAGLRVLEIMHVPGLLQTEEYARAVLSTAVPAWSPTELRRRLSHRMRRRDVLDRNAPPSCTFLIHEAALRMLFGDAGVMRAQLTSLLEASERKCVAVHVIPFEAGGFQAPGLTVTYAYGAVPQLDTVQLDTAHSSVFLDAEAQLQNHRAILDRVSKAALPVRESRSFIRSIAQQL